MNTNQTKLKKNILDLLFLYRNGQNFTGISHNENKEVFLYRAI